MQLVTTVGPSLVAMPVWLGGVCVCVCVCVRTRADVPRSYTSLKLSSFPSLIPFTSLSLILSLTDHSLNPYHVLYSPTSCPCTALGIALTDVTSLLSSLSTRLHPLGPSYPPIYVHSLPSAFPPQSLPFSS